MSSSPFPGEKADEDGGSWRASVQQSYRNAEVREIARVLASLEPGASASSKLRLAMQFEDAVFKSASSLADYRKKLEKRLKRAQKAYVPPSAPSTANKLAVLLQLKQQYGEDIRYILKHASTAIHAMRIKHGDEKALQLKQHIDGVKMWAADLGVLRNTEPNETISEEQLEKLRGLMERKRMENIMAHVVKLADPDRFLLETMEKAEAATTGNEKSSRILAEALGQRYEQLLRLESPPDAMAMYQTALEQLQLPVPPPTRSDRNQNQAALIHLEKIRSASTLLLAWSLLPEKIVLPRNNLAKTQAVTKEGVSFVTTAVREQRKQLGDESLLTLEDAWMKRLVLSKDEVSLEETGTPVTKRPKTNHRPPVIRSSVLLTPGRKTPSNLLAALKRKRAQLVRPEPHGHGTHLVLKFEKAFVMTIFLVPLLVTLRCYSKDEDENDAVEGAKSRYNHQALGCAGSTSFGTGLLEQPELSVWGVKGETILLSHVVRERLRDASIHATHTLRQCFQNLTKEGTADFELEIREATALLEFIQLARTTFIPSWQDDDT